MDDADYFATKQVDQARVNGRDFLVIRSECDRAVYDIKSPKLRNPGYEEVSQRWFGTEDGGHPGVKEF